MELGFLELVKSFRRNPLSALYSITIYPNSKTKKENALHLPTKLLSYARCDVVKYANGVVGLNFLDAMFPYLTNINKQKTPLKYHKERNSTHKFYK